MTVRSAPLWTRTLFAVFGLAWAVAVTVSAAGGRQGSAAKAPVGQAAKPITVSNAPPQAAPPGAWTASDCATCHDKTVNANFQHSAHGKDEQSCATCHKNVSEHFAAKAAGESNAPSPSLKALTVKQVNDTCLTCHEKGARANWHGGMHDRRDTGCISCHSIHSFKSPRAQLKTVHDAETCFTCHKQIRAKYQRTSHHPVREGKMECTACHNPHDSTQAKMIDAPTVNDKCYQCHTEKRGPFLWEHAPVRENCLTCHDPHGSNHPRLTVAMQPYLCQRCHANSGHPGTLYDKNNAVGGPLVAGAPPSGVTTTQTIVSARILSRGCPNCHNQIHGSNSPSGVVFGR
jgi:DmsE family decaheme c-type cytochrome